MSDGPESKGAGESLRQRFKASQVVGEPRRAALIVLGVVVIVAGLFLIGSFIEQSTRPEPATPTLRAAAQQNETRDFLTDTDADGLPDILEDFVYGTDPTRASSSASGIPDGWLVDHGLDPLDPFVGARHAAHPRGAELPAAYRSAELPVRFRLNVSQAYDLKLDPTTYNNTGSSIPDGWLRFYGLPLDDPGIGGKRLGDDRFTVFENYLHNTDPVKADSDDDGLTDFDEVTRHGTDPSRFSTGGSGVPDGWLVRYGLDPADPDIGRRDLDRDGLANLAEYSESVRLVGAARAKAGEGLHPMRASTLGIGVPDGWLVRYGLSPLDTGVASRVTERASAFPDLARDLPASAAGGPSIPDLALTVLDEYRYGRPTTWREDVDGVWQGGTDPTKPDTDGDGLPDVIEIRGWFINVSLKAGPSPGEPLIVFGDPTSADADRDGLTDAEEFAGRAARPGKGERAFPLTNPLARDTDFDGLDDPEEVFGGTAFGRSFDFGTGATRFSPARADSDEDFMGDGAEVNYWSGREAALQASQAYEIAADHTYTSVLEWLRRGGAALAAEQKGTPLSDVALLALVGPGGDLDGDGVPNVLDRDADGDGLLDGWETDPEVYTRIDPALFTLGSTLLDNAHKRAASDPANTDTDGDRLPDGWEVGYGQFDFSKRAFDLNPAKKSSFDEKTAAGAPLLDSERDLDGDGVAWIIVRAGAGGAPAAVDNVYIHTNLRELHAGTDPHVRDTSGDGLPDGFGHFWACVYPEMPDDDKGDVRPTSLTVICGGGSFDPLTRIADTVAHRVKVARFLRDVSDPILRDDLAEEVDGSFASGRVKRIVGTVTYRFESVFRNATNPFLLDTDGDGMADAWEAFYGLTPTNPQDKRLDPDKDRLANVDEFLVNKGATFVANAVTPEALADLAPGTDPTRADTDLGGVGDGDEQGVGGLNDVRLNPDLGDTLEDLDGDGLLGEDDPSPLDPDQDRDGLLDGFNVGPLAESAPFYRNLTDRGIYFTEEGGGRLFLGERSFRSGTDPAKWDSVIPGVPDGFLARQTCLNPLDPLRDDPFLSVKYAWGRPSWWSEPDHGPWRWGMSSCVTDVDNDGVIDWEVSGGRLRFVDFDLDNDGLNDDADMGEDPIPASSHSNVLAADARDPTLEPETRFLRAQAHGLNHSDQRRSATFNADAGAGDPADIPDWKDRIPAEVRDVLITTNGTSFGDGATAIEKGVDFTVAGRVVVQEWDNDGKELATKTPVPNATVIVGLNGRGKANAIGAGRTAADGTFNVTARIAPTRNTTVEPSGVVLFGATSGEVSWAPHRATSAHLGEQTFTTDNKLFVWTTNTSATVGPDHPQRYAFRANISLPESTWSIKTTRALAASPSFTLPVALFTRPVYDIVPSRPDAQRFDSLRVDVRLVDGGGSPIPERNVVVGFTGGDIPTNLPAAGGGKKTLALDADGRGTFDIDVTTGAPGTHHVTASFVKKGGLIEDFILPGPDGAAAIAVRFPVDFTFRTATAVTRAGDLLGISGTVRDNVTGAPAPGNVTVTLGAREVQLPVRADGTYAGDLAVPATLAPGLRTVSAKFSETDLNLEKRADVLVTVKGTARILGVVPAEVKRGADAVVTGRLATALNQSLEGTVSAFLGGRSVGINVTDADGSFRVPVRIPNVNLGKYDFVVRYPGSTAYDATEARVTYTLVSTVRFDVDDPPSEAVRGRTLVLDGVLIDDLGSPTANQGVRSRLHANETSVDVTDAAGRFRLTVPFAANATLETVEVVLEYPGITGGLLKSHRQSLFFPLKADVNLTVRDIEAERGPARIAGTLVDDAGDAVTGAAVDVNVDGVFRGRSLVGPSGGWSLPVTIDTGTPVGRHAVTASFAGSDTHVARVAEGALDVTSGTRVTLAAPRDLIRGTRTEVDGSLVETGGRPVDGERVSFRLNGVEVGTAIAQAGALRASIEVPNDAAIGGGRLEAVFAGTPFLDAGSAARDVQVKAQSKAVIDIPRRLRPGEEFQATVTLTDDRGDPVRGARAVAESPVYPFPVLVETDEEGRATFHGVAPGEGAMRLKVTFAGTDRLAATTFESHAVEIVAPPSVADRAVTLIVAIAVLAAAVLVVGYIVLRRRLLGEVERLLRQAREELVAGNEYVAVIYMAYKRLVAHLAAYGFLKQESATAREFADAVQRALPIDKAALSEFVHIFEEAIYSARAAGAPERDAAIDAFYRIETDLRKYQKSTRPTGG